MFYRRASIGVFAAAFAVAQVLALPARAEVRLLMIEAAGCVYCLRWNAEVGDAYDRTDEGRTAPLLRADLHDPLPEGVRLRVPAVFTPTFVLLNDGHEVGRIEGYPGEHFFWPLLGRLIATLPTVNEESSGS